MLRISFSPNGRLTASLPQIGRQSTLRRRPVQLLSSHVSHCPTSQTLSAIRSHFYATGKASSPLKSSESAEGVQNAVRLSAKKAGDEVKTPVLRAKDTVIPEKVLIYHAGTGRTAFLAMVKVTSLFISAFFCCVAVPAYISAGEPELQTAGFAMAGLIPVFFITFTTAPFVTHIYLQLPATARVSSQALARYVRGVPRTAPLTVTTISMIGKPRYSIMEAGHLRPAKKRFGIVNYVRDQAAQEMAARKWYNYGTVKNFYVQPQQQPAPATKLKKAKKDPVERWIWETIREKIHNRAASQA